MGLPVACGSLDDDAARVMKERMASMREAILILDEDAHREEWTEALGRIVLIAMDW